MSNNSDLLCGICLEIVNLPVKVPSCSHIFCFLCLKEVINSLGKTCPLCRAFFTEEPEDLSLDRSVFDEVVASQKRRVKSIVVKEKVQWQYAGRNVGWWDYDPISNQSIEEAYQESGWAGHESESESESSRDDEFVLPIGASDYTINFRSMEQAPSQNLTRKRSIRRVIIGTQDNHVTKGVAGLDKKHLGD